jgi:hypothetical protein
MGSDLYNKLTDYLKSHLISLRAVRPVLHLLPLSESYLRCLPCILDILRSPPVGIRPTLRLSAASVLYTGMDSVYHRSHLCQQVVCLS